jgi:hypothetical protein
MRCRAVTRKNCQHAKLSLLQDVVFEEIRAALQEDSTLDAVRNKGLDSWSMADGLLLKESGGSMPWPMLTKTKYNKWSLVMKVKMQTWQL